MKHHHMRRVESDWAHMKLAAKEEPEPIFLLLIEPDSHAAREIVSTIPYGEPLYDFHIRRCRSLREGLAYLETSRADIVLMDEAGIEDTDTLHRLYPDMPIVVFDHSRGHQQVCYSLHGAQKCLRIEDCDSMALRRSIREALERKQVELEYMRGDRL